MERQFNTIIFTDGTGMARDRAFEDCSVCGAEKSAYHKAYCQREICPLCGKYLSECHHMEGYTSEAESTEILNVYKGTA